MAFGAQGVRAGAAYVELFTKDGPLVKGLARTSQRLKNWGRSLQTVGRQFFTIGAAAVAGLGLAAKAYMRAGDNLAKMSDRTGVSVESLSALAYAAERSGVSIESLETGLKRMQRVLLDAGRGSKESVDALAMLGLTVDDLKGKSPEQQFLAFARAVSRVEDPSRRAALALMVFGRSGTELLPLFKNGAAGIAQLTERARKLGLTMSEEDARAAEALQDAFTDLSFVLKRIWIQVGSALAPTLKTLAEILLRVAQGVRRWVDAHRAQIVAFAKGAVAVAAFGAALWTLGKTMALTGFLLGLLAKGIGLLLSPIGMVVAGLALATIAWMKWTKGGQQAAEGVRGAFQTTLGDVSSAIGGIRDALLAGDMALASEIFWAVLELQWQRGIYALKALWAGIKQYWADVWATMQSIAARAMHTIVSLVDKATDSLAGALIAAFPSAFGISEEDVGYAVNTINEVGDARRAKGDEEHKKALAAIEAERVAGQSADIERLAESERKIEGLRAKMLSRAQTAALAALAAELTAPSVETEPSLEDLARQLGPPPDFIEIGEQMRRVARGPLAEGRFDPSRVRELGGGLVSTDRIAVAVEKTAKNTKDIADKLDDAETLSFD